MVLIMSIGFGWLPAHSGPPSAASQGNSCARTLRSPSVSVTHVVFTWFLRRRAAARSNLLLWFMVFPLLGEGKTHQTIEGELRALDGSGPIRREALFTRRVLTRFVLKYTLSAAHLELGGVEREVRRCGKP